MRLVWYSRFTKLRLFQFMFCWTTNQFIKFSRDISEVHSTYTCIDLISEYNFWLFWWKLEHLFLPILFENIYLFIERQSYTKRREVEKSESFHLLLHSPDGCKDQNWARPKPKGRCFIPVSMQVLGPEGLRHLLPPPFFFNSWRKNWILRMF